VPPGGRPAFFQFVTPMIVMSEVNAIVHLKNGLDFRWQEEVMLFNPFDRGMLLYGSTVHPSDQLLEPQLVFEAQARVSRHIRSTVSLLGCTHQ
jgi:hypothetical protein